MIRWSLRRAYLWPASVHAHRDARCPLPLRSLPRFLRRTHHTRSYSTAAQQHHRVSHRPHPLLLLRSCVLCVDRAYARVARRVSGRQSRAEQRAGSAVPHTAHTVGSDRDGVGQHADQSSASSESRAAHCSRGCRLVWCADGGHVALSVHECALSPLCSAVVLSSWLTSSAKHNEDKKATQRRHHADPLMTSSGSGAAATADSAAALTENPLLRSQCVACDRHVRLPLAVSAVLVSLCFAAPPARVCCSPLPFCFSPLSLPAAAATASSPRCDGARNEQGGIDRAGVAVGASAGQRGARGPRSLRALAPLLADAANACMSGIRSSHSSGRPRSIAGANSVSPRPSRSSAHAPSGQSDIAATQRAQHNAEQQQRRNLSSTRSRVQPSCSTENDAAAFLPCLRPPLLLPLSLPLLPATDPRRLTMPRDATPSGIARHSPPFAQHENAVASSLTLDRRCSSSRCSSRRH